MMRQLNVPCPSSISWKWRLINLRTQRGRRLRGGPPGMGISPRAAPGGIAVLAGGLLGFTRRSSVYSSGGLRSIALWASDGDDANLLIRSASDTKSSEVGADWSRKRPTRVPVLAARICSCCRLSLFKAACCEGVPADGSFRATTPGLRNRYA